MFNVKLGVSVAPCHRFLWVQFVLRRLSFKAWSVLALFHFLKENKNVLSPNLEIHKLGTNMKTVDLNRMLAHTNNRTDILVMLLSRMCDIQKDIILFSKDVLNYIFGFWNIMEVQGICWNFDTSNLDSWFFVYFCNVFPIFETRQHRTFSLKI